jgi:hypothetical protein
LRNQVDDVEKAFEHSLSADTETQDGKKVLGANGGFLQVSDSFSVTSPFSIEARIPPPLVIAKSG